MKSLASTILINVVLFSTIFVAIARGEDFRLLYGLRGDWKFEIGDDSRFASKNYDDSKWETIFAPAPWEDEGFPGYDGYAWYRKHFQAEADWKDKVVYVRLGRIDDIDQVYVNGKLIGSTGSFAPQYETAYNIDRDYFIPASCLNIPGDNVIAVRVYDERLSGGIYTGKLGIYEDRSALIPEIPLAGEWKFRTGDNPLWKEKNIPNEGGALSAEATLNSKSKETSANGWSAIRVPGNWEFQGYGAAGNTNPQDFAGYDGFAWYRIRFFVPKEYADKRMILVLGKIDDYDETYLNGELVGKTGRMGTDVHNSDAWSQLRAYTILPNQLIAGEENVIAVRVFDGWRGGGIYEGPIGLASRDRFLKWQNRMKRDLERGIQSIWDIFK